MAKIQPSPIIVRSTDTEVMKQALGGVLRPSPAAGPSSASAEQGLEPRPELEVGRTVAIPIAKVRENPMNARVFYSTGEVDDMAKSLAEHGQEVPAKGYAEDQHIVLVDGQKRLRGARAIGLETLRVEICEKPKSDQETYLASRRINKERSDQSALDDAVRFRELLETGRFENQSVLGKAVGMSQPNVSRIVALNSIPERIMRRLKDTHLPNSVDALYALSQVFTKLKDDEKAEQLVATVIDAAVKDELSGLQTIALINSRLAGPRRRDRNEVRHITFGSSKGTLKTNLDKGRLDFSIKDLHADMVNELREKIEAWSQEATSSSPPTAA